MKRLARAAALAVLIYAAALALGTTLYATGVIGNGATHNNCIGFQEKIAEAQGIPVEDVQQQQVKAATEDCLDARRLTKWQAFRSEYIVWAAWPAVVVAAIFLLWPAWSQVLHNQEQAEARARMLEAGGGRSERT
ncbi:MAG: hypothetical protein IVW36_10290 [Dehalococcoidia bacterium]|nr:hypothetical protein [Dehalococcoidia bacterium]